MADPEQFSRELSAAVHGVGPDGFGQMIADAVSKWVAFDAVRLVCTNPAAVLALGSFSCWHRYDRDLLEALVLDRFRGGDPCRPEDLVGRQSPVGIVDAADERGSRARCTGELLAAHGVHCELRALLRDRSGVWGFLGLARAYGARPFDHQDVERVTQLGPILAKAIREFARDCSLVPAAPALRPGVFTIGPDHHVRGITSDAQAWFARLWMPEERGVLDWVATPFAEELSMRIRARVDAGREDKPLICASVAGAGRWIAVHGQLLDSAGADDIAVVIEAARGDVLLPSFCHWYGITARERSVLELLCRGESPRMIAKALDLSAHTVNDHLKSIYRKTAADGRDELLAAVTT
ncbi:helix-turn-helix transcriptional regulator [Nocardia sp. NPDC050175]|uniref:helix-turn-helix transcriptional regulator n=1 Tax=Nocardia sp. NPDC050175 TaxID=3364317 RepID=UPI0037A4A412